MKKICCWANYKWVIIQNQAAILEIKSNYATKKKLDRAAGAYTSDLLSKKDFNALEAKVDKLDINRLVNFPTSLNNVKIKLDDFDVSKVKTVLVDMTKLSDNEVVKNPKFNTLKAK